MHSIFVLFSQITFLSHWLLETFEHVLNFISLFSRGVFQTLVEKHFPAPDRKKTSDWFNSKLWDDSPVPSPDVGGKKMKKKGEILEIKDIMFIKDNQSDFPTFSFGM